MNRDIEAAVLSQLGNAQDNLARARAKFRTFTTERMVEQYGDSGLSCGEIVAGYEREVERWEQALKDCLK